MKRICVSIATSLLLLILPLLLNAQCSGGRYHDLVFPGNPVVTYDVVYGSNVNYQGVTESLKLDIYEPACDNATNRALVVFAHGGSFMGGDKGDASYVQTAVGLAQLGYVVASINYRLGFPFDQYGFNSAIMRGVHDARAAIRFMRDNALNGGNTWGVDPNNIFFGGASAGGIMALHLAYQNLQSEHNLSCGGQPGSDCSSIEGNSNSLAVSSSVKAIVSISGGIRDLNWITNNDVPVYLVHGTNDGTVPYGSGTFGGFFPVHGSSSIAARTVATNTTYCLTPMYGQDHTITNVAYVDTVATIMRNFLEHFTCGTALNCNYNGSPTAAASSVSINISSGTNPTCAGQPVTFTATPVNGGASPTYQWKRNGANVGINSSTYTLASPANNDVITVVMTPDASCTAPTPVTSNAITMTVNATSAPSVSINITSGSNPTCAGQPITFSATPINGGSSPSYQWKKNGANVGTNSNTYTLSTPANNDMISVVLTSNSACANPTTATSNTITLTTTTTVTPSVGINITSGSNPTCSGQAVTFTATPTNGGSSPSYQWKKNGANVGTNSNTYTLSAPANNDMVSVVMTSSSACASPATATSNSITMSVSSSLTPSVSVAITDGTNPTCQDSSVTFTATPTNGGSTPAYQWKVNGANAGSNNSSFTSATLADNDAVSVVMTSTATCANPALASSTPVNVMVNTPPTISQSGNALTASTGSTWQWYLDGQAIPGATAQSYTATASGNYAVEADGSSCRSAVLLVDVTSAGSIQYSAVFKLYPNPGTYMFSIESSIPMQSIRLFDVTGRQLRLEEPEGRKNHTIIHHLQPGIYFVEVRFAAASATIRKLVVGE